MPMKGPISTPSMCETNTSTTPSGSPVTNGIPGLPPRSAHPMGVNEVTFESSPKMPDMSGRTIAPVTPPLFKPSTGV